MIGLFLLTPALAYDPAHARLQAILDAHLHAGLVDYAALKAAPAPLDAYLADVAITPLATLPEADRTAFWIDAYNALTLDVVADAWPIASIRDLDGGKVWDIRHFPVGGASLTLNDLEGKLRAEGDPRVHAALNCASKGCPPLSPTVFTGAGLDKQLDAAAGRWAATARLSAGKLAVNHIFDWYSGDFLPKYGKGAFDVPGVSGSGEAAANFVARFAPERAAELHKGGYRVEWAPYDWSVNNGR